MQPLVDECESIAKTTTRVTDPPPQRLKTAKSSFSRPLEDAAKQLASENRGLGWWRHLQFLVVVLHCWHLDFLVYHVWDTKLSQPCFGSDREAQEKIFVTLLDMFVLHPPPAPALRDCLSVRRAMSCWAVGTARWKCDEAVARRCVDKGQEKRQCYNPAGCAFARSSRTCVS